jgi:hypothetical protein
MVSPEFPGILPGILGIRPEFASMVSPEFPPVILKPELISTEFQESVAKYQ